MNNRWEIIKTKRCLSQIRLADCFFLQHVWDVKKQKDAGTSDLSAAVWGGHSQPSGQCYIQGVESRCQVLTISILFIRKLHYKCIILIWCEQLIICRTSYFPPEDAAPLVYFESHPILELPSLYSYIYIAIFPPFNRSAMFIACIVGKILTDITSTWSDHTCAIFHHIDHDYPQELNLPIWRWLHAYRQTDRRSSQPTSGKISVRKTKELLAIRWFFLQLVLPCILK